MSYFIIRLIAARWLPFLFARWVNRERCYIAIRNNPDGDWTVTIGCRYTGREHKSLGKAMLSALMKCERDNEWIWTSQFLKGVQ